MLADSKNKTYSRNDMCQITQQASINSNGSRLPIQNNQASSHFCWLSFCRLQGWFQLITFSSD